VILTSTLTSASPSALLSTPLLAEDADGRASRGGRKRQRRAAGCRRTWARSTSGPFRLARRRWSGLAARLPTRGRLGPLPPETSAPSASRHVPRPEVLQRARPQSVHCQLEVCSGCTLRLISYPAEIICHAGVHLGLSSVGISEESPCRNETLPWIFCRNALHGTKSFRACPECNEGVTIASFAVLHDLTFPNPYAKVAPTYLMSDSSYLIFRSSVRGAA